MSSAGIAGKLIVSSTSSADVSTATGHAIGDGAEDASVVKELISTHAGHAGVSGIAHGATADGTTDARSIHNRESRIALSTHVVGASGATRKRARNHALASD